MKTMILNRTRLTCRILSAFIAFTFSFTSVLPPAYAQSIGALNLPAPGTMVSVTPGFTPIHISGITINPDNPLQFDFIINTGDTHLNGEELKAESEKLIKYFLASLTVPEEDLWVNLSPYEKERIVAKGFGDTVMGRDMLAQDYILKQLAASMMYPEKELGKKFWDRVYQKAQERYGSTEIPMNTFNKIWIVPDEAVVYQQGSSAFVIKSRLKVMLEEDYLALQNNLTGEVPDAKVVSGISAEIVREILVPEIEKEVNEGETFANLRQIYNSLILATWYKTNLKESLLGQIYVNQNKTKGIDTQDKRTNENIYKQYVESFKKGVYNYIREDRDPVTQELIPRKYFSGGVNAVYNPIKKLFLSAIIGTGLLIGTPGSPARADVANVLNHPNQILVTTRMAEKQEEATIITSKAREQINAPELVTTDASVDLGNALSEGDVRIDNRSGQPVDLGRKATEFFPTTEDGTPIIKDAIITIVNTEKEAQQLASSPIMQKGKSGNILRNLIFATVLGTLTCFGAGCGKSGDSGDSNVEQPGEQDHGIDMTTKSVTELRALLDNASWAVQRDAALEIYARFERQVNQETFWALERAKEKLVNPRIAKLTSEDPAVTTTSVEYQQLLELRPILKDPLKKWLENENADVNTRKWAEQLLEEIIDDILKQYDEILPSLRTVLQNPNSQIYDFAVGKVQSLIYRHPLALSTGIALLKDPVAGVRIAAANTLADLGFESAIIPLGNARTLERDPKVITALDDATNALLQVTRMTSWSLEDLKTALASPYWSIQKIAIHLVLDRGTPEDRALAVAQIQKQIDQLTSADDNTRNTNPYIHLLELGEDAVAPLRANAENTNAYDITRQWSLDLLTQLLPYQEVFPTFEVILKDPSQPFYPLAIDGLTRLILAQVDPLALGVELLNSQVTGVRIAAIGALGQTGKDAAIAPLKNVISTSTDPAEVAAAQNVLNTLYGNVNLATWSRTDLISELDNSAFWTVQKRAAQELFRRNDAEGIALARTKLVSPRIAKMEFFIGQNTSSLYYVELVELGYIVIEPLVEEIQKNGQGPNNASQLVAILLGTMGEFNDVANAMASVTVANGYNEWHAQKAKEGLDLLYARQAPEFLITVLNDTDRLMLVQVTAAAHLGIKKYIPAIDDLEKKMTLTSDANFITTINTALSQILTSMTVGTYDAVFDRLVNTVLIHPEYSIYSAGVEELKKLILANQWRDNVWGLMSHDVAGVRMGAVRALGEINDQRVFIPLKTALSDPEKLVRFYAAEALGKQEKAAYLPDLVALRDREQDPEVVLSAEKAIVRISIANDLLTSLSNRQLIIGLDVDNWPTQSGAAQELSLRKDAEGIRLAREKLAWPRIQKLGIYSAALPYYQEIIQLGDTAIEPLKEKFLLQQFTNTGAVQYAAILLGTIGQFDDVFPLLLYPFDKPGYAAWHQEGAKSGLISLISGQPQERLIELLEHHRPEVRLLAARNLKNRGDERASDALIARLPASATAWDERQEVAWALANIVETRAVDPILTALAVEPDYRTRDIMILFLGNAGDPRANDVLGNALRTETDPQLRGRAAESSRKIGDPAALPGLRERLTAETNGAVLNAIRKAITWITELDASGVLDIRGDQTAVDELIIAATNPSSAAIRYFATRELGNLRAEQAITTLENLRSTETDPEVIFMIEASLKKIFLTVDVAQWSDPRLMEALDKTYWPIQQKAALELKRRGQAEGTALSLTKLFEPRKSKLARYDLRAMDESEYQELKSLGPLIEGSLLGIIHDTNVNVNIRRWMMMLKADTGEFDPTYVFLRSVINDTTGVYSPWGGGAAQNALVLLFKRQSVTAITDYLRDPSDIIQIAAAKALGAKGDAAALPVLEAIAADTTESPEVINAVEAAIGQINAANSPVVAASSPVTAPMEEKKVGGIDFNPALLNLQIKRDRFGVPLPLPQQPVKNIHIDGLFPVIINITPLPSLLPLLGLDPSNKKESMEVSRLN